MARPIDADALLAEYDRQHVGEPGRARKLIEDAPTVDAEPVRHGRWEWREYWGAAAFQNPPEMYDAGWACSACGTDLLQYLQSHFPDIPSYTECASEEKPTLKRCPNCGAKMDAKEENEK